jgi:hypothetical protein
MCEEDWGNPKTDTRVCVCVCVQCRAECRDVPCSDGHRHVCAVREQPRCGTSLTSTIIMKMWGFDGDPLAATIPTPITIPIAHNP